MSCHAIFVAEFTQKMVKEILKQTRLYNWYLQRKFDKIDHKMYESALVSRSNFVDEYIPKGTVGAELGVLKGNFSKVLLDISRPMKLYLVDPWYLLGSRWSWADGNQSTVDALIRVIRKFKSEIENRQIEVIIGDDLKFLAGLSDESLDWVYLDSSHDYEHTVKELELLMFKVKKNGVIAGDDWRIDESHKHHGVAKAVKEFVSKYDYEVIYSNESNLQWAVKARTTNRVQKITF